MKTTNITDSKSDRDWVSASIKYFILSELKHGALGVNRNSSNITLAQSLYLQTRVRNSANQNLSPAIKADYNFTVTQSDG